jgi:hypothetical protein
MGNKATLRPKPFTSENQPPKERKSRKGIPNRSTVFKRLLAIKTKLPHPADASKELNVTLYEAAALGQILAAQHGNHNAWKEIQDTLHGKLTEKTESDIRLRTEKDLTDDELAAIAKSGK